MSLKNQRCDRCQELSEGLFRLSWDLERPTVENPWYCINCMRLMGEPLSPETLRIVQLLREWQDL